MCAGNGSPLSRMAAQRWRKLGRVFCPEGQYPWMTSHASYPVGLPLDDRVVRVFFSPRDAANRSSMAWLDMVLAPTGFTVRRLCERPLLGPGERGAFDDSGVTVGCVLRHRGELRVYYLGWSLGVTVPFRNFIGLASGALGADALERVSPAPILDRCAVDPLSLSYPWVVADGQRWRMWYGSHLRWGDSADDMVHVIKQAYSPDGLRWERPGTVAIGVEEEHEFAVSRPSVLRDSDRWRMWYSRRVPSYTLGYAESADGERWARCDSDCGLRPSEAGWDSETVEYASVFDHGGGRFMLYNGNGFGRSGFGVAVLDGWGS